MQFDWLQNGTWDHSAIVVDIVGGIAYIASHTTDYRAAPYNLQTNTKYRFIHIERSNGYPPVKAKITAFVDDAGENPIYSPYYCGTGSTYYPEVYFGKCPDGSSVDSGFQFKNVQIPKGAQIKYAYITFTVDGTYTVPIEVKIDGEKTGNPASFTSSLPGSDARSQLLTNNPVAWSIASTDIWSLGSRRTVPNLSNIVQTIVDGILWGNENNTLSFIFKDNGTTIPTIGNPPPSPVRRVISSERANTGGGIFSPAKLIAVYDLPGNTSISPLTVLSITRASANPTSAYEVGFTVAFSKPVSGVDTNDFRS